MKKLEIAVERHQMVDPILKLLIRQFWWLNGGPDVDIRHQLMPSAYPEIIYNFSGPIWYDGEAVSGMHYNGARTESCIIKQKGPVCVLGISLYPAGIKALLGTEGIVPSLGEMNSLISGFGSWQQKALALETVLLERICQDLLPEYDQLKLIRKFHVEASDISIRHFCEQEGIHERKLERLFKNLLGVSPKTVQRVLRFQKTLGRIEAGALEHGELTGVALDGNYYDQNHFIKEFKSFSGLTPTEFIVKKPSVRQFLKP